MSLPSWERGLKLQHDNFRFRDHVVAPLVGAWIEITTMIAFIRGFSVAPLVGATIEIEKTIVYNVLCDYIEGGHLIEQDGQAKRLGNGNAYGSPILEKRNDTGRIRDGKQIFE